MKKKVLIILIVVVVMSLSAGAIAFAAETKEPTKQDKQELRVERAEKRFLRLSSLFETYYPEGVDALVDNREAHIEFHESAKADREELRAGIKEMFTEIKESFENGDINKTEARTQIVALKSSIEEMRAEFKVVVEEKQAAQSVVKDSLIVLRDEMKVLLQADEVDAIRVKEILKSTFPLLQQHVENDVFYHGQFLDIVEQYGF